jgi:hypothetical protein
MRWPAGVAAIAAFAVAGCGGTTSSIGAGASDLVPASAPAFVAVDTDPGSSQWKTVDALASRFPDKQKGIDSIKQDMQKDGVDWAKDVKPALGKELDFAWLDFANNGRNFVILAQPGDEGAFERLIKKANDSETDPKQRVVYDKYRDWEVLAFDRSTIDRFERASDSSAPTLADQSAFKHAMDRLGGDAVVRAYVNGPFLMNLARRYGGNQIRPYLDKVGTLDWIALRSGATSRGVGLDVIVHGTPGKLFNGATGFGSFKPKLIGSVPQDALLYYTFHGSKNMFSGLQQNAFFANPQYRPFRRILGDVGRLLEGENALYVRPGAGHAPGVPFAIPEVTLIATPGHGTDGAAVIDKLLKREAGVDPSFTTIGGRAVRKLASQDLGLFYTDVGDKLVVTDEPAGIRGAANGGTPLSKSDTFTDVADASGLPSKNQGFLYVDIHSTVPLVEKLAHAHVPAEVARNLKPLRSAVEYAVAKSHEFQVTFFLRIK